MSAITRQAQTLPRIIQGGMGVAVSSWQLARAVSCEGELGVVSGTALDAVLARRLQDGDPEGDVRRALEAFPVRALADEIVDHYFREGGRGPGEPYLPTPRPSLTPSPRAQHLVVLGNFVEVWLAKEGHDGLVGVNYLEKIQMTTPWSAYGAMLAGVDVVLMGAGIPAHIPAMLDSLAEHRTTSLPVDVVDAPEGASYAVTIEPSEITAGSLPTLARPVFLAIVASHVLAQYLARDAVTRPDGFVVEAPTAGGHNAPPRGTLVLDESGQPVYGPRDEIVTEKFVTLGIPFWLAGSYGSPERLRDATAAGAAGVQVGTLFAMSRESGFMPELRQGLTRTPPPPASRSRSRRSPARCRTSRCARVATRSATSVICVRPSSATTAGWTTAARQSRRASSSARAGTPPRPTVASVSATPSPRASASARPARTGSPSSRS
jgi:NAD(P)H-dependent flavin oxidoreductase YrpB (nitropropane dioxygenase family)